MRVLVFILLGIVAFETHYIFKNIKGIGKKTAEPKAVVASGESKNITPVEVEEVKKVVETNLNKEIIVNEVEPSGVPHFYRVRNSRQSFWLEDRSGLICMGALIDSKSKINLSTGEEIIVINGFLHPSKSMGLKMGNPENRAMMMREHQREEKEENNVPSPSTPELAAPQE